MLELETTTENPGDWDAGDTGRTCLPAGDGGRALAHAVLPGYGVVAAAVGGPSQEPCYCAVQVSSGIRLYGPSASPDVSHVVRLGLLVELVLV